MMMKRPMMKKGGKALKKVAIICFLLAKNYQVLFGQQKTRQGMPGF